MTEAMGAAQFAEAVGYEPNCRREGESYIIGFPAFGVSFDVSRLDIGREIHAWVRVTSTNPGTPSLLTNQRYNLSGPGGRSAMGKYLASRCPAVEDWPEIIETMCGFVLDAIREGEPIVRLAEVRQRTESIYRAEPVVIDQMPVVMFGEGGSGKSLVAFVVGLAIHSGLDLCGLNVNPGPVLLCDWETDEVTARERVESLARGFGIEDEEQWSLHYRACFAPLYEEAEAIGRYISREGVVAVIVDSLGAASGGDKNSQEVTQRMFSAIRAWRTAPLLIDHIAKEQQGKVPNTPYGSVYTVNLARSVWRVRGVSDENSNTLHVGMFQTKTNVDRWQPPLGFRFIFGEGEILCEREDVKDNPDLEESLPASQRIKLALLKAKKALTVEEVSEATGLKERVTRTRLGDLVKRGDVVKIEISGGANKYALKAERDE